MVVALEESVEVESDPGPVGVEDVSEGARLDVDGLDDDEVVVLSGAVLGVGTAS